MDIFRFRDHLTRDYAEYVRSFIRIGTPDERRVVERAIDDQLQWPEPIIQLRPFCLLDVAIWTPSATTSDRMPSQAFLTPARTPPGVVRLRGEAIAIGGGPRTHHGEVRGSDPS